MTDIVDDLRAAASMIEAGMTGFDEDLRAAADEIERLRAAIVGFIDATGDPEDELIYYRIDRIQAAFAMLRAEAERIGGMWVDTSTETTADARSVLNDALYRPRSIVGRLTAITPEPHDDDLACWCCGGTVEDDGACVDCGCHVAEQDWEEGGS